MSHFSNRVDGDSLPVMAATALAPGVASLGSVAGVLARLCQWCRSELTETQAKWCSKRCRQTAWRFRQIAVVEDLGDTPKRLVYADPAYPGLAYKYYRNEPSYGGEVDHARLLDQLTTSGYDGWALSTSREALRDVLSLVPAWVDPIVCPWIKTHHEPRARGPANKCEFVIVVPARRRMPGPPDCLVAAVARGGDSDLIGRKPLEFVSWLFQLLGAAPRDTLEDLFPGSGIVGRCWDEFCRSAPSLTPASATPRGDAP